MKEAAGEANMTVITIILIGVIAAIAIPMVNSAMESSALKGACSSVGGYMDGKTCKGPNNKTFTCAKNANTGGYTCK